jgi:hypothetical protein
MLYHTAIIILHRPPRSVLKDPEVAVSQDVQTCYESLEAIIKLLRTYSRYYEYYDLPFTFVHTLATAASVLLMKRYIEDLSWDNVAVSKPLGHVLEAIDAVSQTWPCARQVRSVVNSAMEGPPQDKVGYTPSETFDSTWMILTSKYIRMIIISWTIHCNGSRGLILELAVWSAGSKSNSVLEREVVTANVTTFVKSSYLGLS